jgi:AraC family ethanolamine operon transcriptional activator
MPSHLFNEFEAYAAAVNDAHVRMLLPRLNVPHWEIATQSVGSIHLQKGLERSGIIAEGCTNHIDLMLFIPLWGSQSANGVNLGETSILVIPPKTEFVIRSQVEHAWCSLRLPEAIARQIPGYDLAASRQWPGSRVLKLDPHQLNAVRRLVLEAFDALAANPLLFQNPGVEAAMEAAILDACRRTLAIQESPYVGPGRLMIDRGRIIRALKEEINNGEPECPAVPVLAKNAGVSERTLRSICLEYFGVSPQRYITIHRLNQARQDLIASDPRQTKIATIAGKLGFWHLGRFSSQYRELFGELPSESLAKYNR